MIAIMWRFSLLALFALGCAVDAGQYCELNSDCLVGTCVDGVCKRECADSELDCPKGYTCNKVGICEYGASGGAGGTGAASGGTGGSGNSVTSGSTTSSSTTATTNSTAQSSSSGSMTMKSILSPCAIDNECASGMCRSMRKDGGVKRCTDGCASNAQCPSGFRCETVNSETFCIAHDIGRTCDMADDCLFACLTTNGYCTSTCNSGADCPNGYGCMPVGSPATNVCVRTSADCAADSTQCVVPAACDSSPTLVVSSCTIACNTAADCPQRALSLPPWTCDGLCRRPGDVSGPLPGGFEPAQWACNGSNTVVNVCGDGLHLDFDTFTQPNPPAVSCGAPTTTDGLPGDACLDSCRLGAGCPYGFACAGLAEVGGQRIGLCMTAGGGEVGANCAKNIDCVFGTCQSGKCSRDCSKDGLCPDGSQCVNVGGTAIEGFPAKRCQ
jgi:hypothetical protein